MNHVLTFFFLSLFNAAFAQDSLPKKQQLNSIRLQYEYSMLAEKISLPWHFSNIAYGCKFKKTPLLIRLNHARRFGINGLQLESDIYPKISKKIYSFINFGWSDNILFPRYRAGASMYISLPHAYEAEGGFRYLFFNNPVFIYTTSLGKYYKKFWFNAATFLTPADGILLKSLFLKTRFYKNDEDYFMLAFGKGVSPDERNRLNNISATGKLRALSIEGSMQKILKNNLILDIKVGWFKQESPQDVYMNRFSAASGLTVKF